MSEPLAKPQDLLCCPARETGFRLQPFALSKERLCMFWETCLYRISLSSRGGAICHQSTFRLLLLKHVQDLQGGASQPPAFRPLHVQLLQVLPRRWITHHRSCSGIKVSFLSGLAIKNSGEAIALASAPCFVPVRNSLLGTCIVVYPRPRRKLAVHITEIMGSP